LQNVKIFSHLIKSDDNGLDNTDNLNPVFKIVYDYNVYIED